MKGFQKRNTVHHIWFTAKIAVFFLMSCSLHWLYSFKITQCFEKQGNLSVSVISHSLFICYALRTWQLVHVATFLS